MKSIKIYIPKILGVLVAVTGFGLHSVSAQAVVITEFQNDQTGFLAGTSATSATGPLGSLGNVGTSVTIGDLDFSADDNIYVQEWTTLLSGNEIAVSGAESLDITISASFTSSLLAFGFDWVDPEFIDSVQTLGGTHTIEFLSGGTSLGIVGFMASSENTATFMGFSLDTPFDTVLIREVQGPDQNKNEYWGEFYTKAAAVPEPGTLALLGLGLVGMAARRRGKKV